MIQLLIALLLAFCTPKTAVLNVALTQNLLASSVVIRAKVYSTHPETKEVKRGLVGCSGTYISSNTVLTAAHCFDMKITDIWVRGVDGVSHTAKLKKIAPEKDLALIVLDKGKSWHFAKLSKSVRVGEAVFNVGSPFMFEFLVSEGVVAQINQKIPISKAKYLVTTAMINSGSSGGGAFNAEGELIGVNNLTVGGFFGWAGISMAVDRHTIAVFLKEK